MIRERDVMTKKRNGTPKIKVSTNGPYIVTGRIPLLTIVTRTDAEGYCHGWETIASYPSQDQYALCRCGHSSTKPYCDGMHMKIKFDGTETGSRKPYLTRAEEIAGPNLKLTDARDLCVHARFCLRAGGIWDLVEHSDNPEAKRLAIEEAGNCPAGRLVVWDRKTEKILEPVFERSIGLIEYPQINRSGSLWVRGEIPVESADGFTYEIRNRITLCRCGKSSTKPFCDGSHLGSHLRDH